MEKADAQDSSTCVVSGASLTTCIKVCSITMNGVDQLFGSRTALSIDFHALTIDTIIKQPQTLGTDNPNSRSPNSGQDCALRAVPEVGSTPASGVTNSVRLFGPIILDRSSSSILRHLARYLLPRCRSVRIVLTAVESNAVWGRGQAGLGHALDGKEHLLHDALQAGAEIVSRRVA